MIVPERNFGRQLARLGVKDTEQAGIVVGGAYDNLIDVSPLQF